MSSVLSSSKIGIYYNCCKPEL